MAQRYDLILDQGASFTQEFELFDVNDNPDETQYVPVMMMRKHFNSNVAYTFSTALDNGILVVSMPAANTASIEPGRYVYDIELTSGNTVTRILEGIVTVTPEVSR